MMDVGISGNTSAPDAAAAAKAAAANDKANGGGEKTGGFLDALKNARSEKHQQDASDDKNASPATDSEPDQNTASVPGTTQAQPQRPKKPIIDLSQTHPLFSGKQTAQTQTDVEADAAAKLQAAKDKSITAKTAKTAKSDDGVAETVTDPRITKLAKMAAGDKGAVDTETSDDDLSDVLTLLKGGDTTDPKMQAQPTANIAHHLQAATATADTKAKSNTDTGKITDAVSALHAVVTGSTDETAVPGAETETDADSGTVFRLTRADGRGKSLDITSSGKGEDSLADIKEAKSGQIENVSVLESRRYLGLAQNTNSSSVVSALSSDGEWSSAMQPSSALANAASWTSTGKVVNTLKIQMHPIELGLVTATMRLQGEELSVDLKVENGSAYRQLKEDQGKIVESLRAQGFAIDNVTISIAAVDRSDSSAQSGNQGQAQQQPSQNQAQGGQAQARQQSSSERQAENGRGVSLAETGVDETSTADSGRSRPGHVYM